MDEKLIITNTHESGLTQTVRARYARYMSTTDVLTDVTPTNEQSLTAGTKDTIAAVGHVFKENKQRNALPNEAIGIKDKAIEQAAAKKDAEHQENLKKANILHTLWEALAKVFTCGGDLQEAGVGDALSLSIVFSEAVAKNPLSAWKEDKLQAGYVNWYKLLTSYDKSPAVQAVAKAGMQEIKSAVGQRGEDVEVFEAKAKGYFVDNKEKISVENLKEPVIAPDATKAEEPKVNLVKERAEFLLAHKDRESEVLTPIVSGQEFSPFAELKRIKLHGAEGKEAIAIYKEKLVYQHEGLMELRKDVLKKIATNPAISRQDLDKQTADYAYRYGFDSGQLEAIVQLTDSYVEKQQRITELHSNHATDEEGKVIDPAKLYEEVIGRKPEAAVEAKFAPMEVLFIVKDPKEYREAIGEGQSNRNLSPEERAYEEKSQGKLLAKVAKDGLENMVVVVASDDPAVIAHEEMHVLNRHVLPLVEQASGERTSTYLEDQLKQATTEEDKRKAADAYNQRLLSLRMIGFQDEIISHSKQGLTADQIKTQLLHPDSSYRVNKQKELREIIVRDPENAALLQGSFDRAFARYEKTVRDGIDALHSLVQTGKYTQEQAFGLLSMVPLDKWSATVRHQLAEDIDKDYHTVGTTQGSLESVQEARIRNAEKPEFVPDEKSPLRENAAYEVSPTMLNNLDIDSYRTNPDVMTIIDNLRDPVLRGARLGNAAIADTRHDLETLPRSTEKLSALADIDKLANQAFQAEIQGLNEMLHDPRERELRQRVGAAVKIIDIYLHEPNLPPSVASDPADRMELALPAIKQLQEYVWHIQRNIEQGNIVGSGPVYEQRKKIIDDFSDEFFEKLDPHDPATITRIHSFVNELITEDAGNAGWRNKWAVDGEMKLAGLVVDNLFGNMVTEQKKREHISPYDVPKDFDEVLRLSVLPDLATDYQEGNRYEIRDRKGKVNYANLDRAIRQKMMDIHLSNDKDPSIDMFNRVAFLGIVQLNLGTILINDRFAIDRKVRIKGDLTRDNSFEPHVNLENQPQAYEIPEWMKVRTSIKSFAWYFGLTHNAHVNYDFQKVEGVAKVLKAILTNDFVAGDKGGIENFFRMASINNNEEYMEDIMGGKTGELGKAMQMVWLSIGSIVELSNNTRNLTRTEEEGILRKKKVKHKVYHSDEEYFKNNKFYKILTNLGRTPEEEAVGVAERMRKPEVLDAFFFKFINESVGYSVGYSPERVKLYKDFVTTQLQKEYDSVDATTMTGDEKDEYKRTIQDKMDEVNTNTKMEVKMDTIDALAEVKMKNPQIKAEIESRTNTRIITENNRLIAAGEPTLTEDKKKEIKKETEKLVQKETRIMVQELTRDAMLDDRSGPTYLERLVPVDAVYDDLDAGMRIDQLKADYRTAMTDRGIQNYERYAKFEKFAYRTLKLINPKFNQSSLNIFDAGNKHQVLIGLVRNAIKTAAGTAYNLESLDATVAEETMYYLSNVLFNGFAAADTGVQAFDPASKFINEAQYMKKSADGRGGTVNRLGIPTIRHGILPFFDWLTVNGKSLTEIIQGGDGDTINLGRELPSMGSQQYQNDMARQWATVDMENTENLYNHRDSHEFEFSKIIKLDMYGRSVIDYPAAQKLFKERWQFIRYSLGGSGGRALDEAWKEEGDRKPKRKMRWWSRDYNSGEYSFNTTSEEEYFFGNTVRELRDRQHERALKKMSKKEREDAQGGQDAKWADEYARAVLKKDIADQLHERFVDTNLQERWYVSQLNRIRTLYSQYAATETHVDEHHTAMVVPFFTDDDWADILWAAGTSLGKIYLKQILTETGRGFLGGVFAMIGQTSKKLFAETTK